MPMNESLSLVAPLAEGALIGALFFGGLWWTVRKGIASQRPALWFLLSMVVRMSIALLGFYAVGRDHWERWLPCLIGFALARLLVQHQSRRLQVSHAP
jgi:F1F0 ATPase subunit 2